MPRASSRSSRTPGELLAEPLEERAGRVGVALEPGPGDAHVERERDEPLLRAVVEVALDPAAGRVGGLEMRAREARSSAVRAASISRRRSASSASRRSVMSKIAPSIQRRPPGPWTSWPRSSTQRTRRRRARSGTRARTAVGLVGRPRRRRAIASRSSGWMMLMQRPPRAGDEVGRRVAGDALDLVADQLELWSGVPGRAVDRAGHVDHQRAQSAVVERCSAAAGPARARASSRCG